MLKPLCPLPITSGQQNGFMNPKSLALSVTKISTN
jgi:hypothetical protein